MSERLTYDIARDLRAPGPWPSVKLLTEAADKLEGLIELLAAAETKRDQAQSLIAAVRRQAEEWEAEEPDWGLRARTVGSRLLELIKEADRD